jgi:hypothetical protein
MTRKILFSTVSDKDAYPSKNSWNSLKEFLKAFRYAQELWAFSLAIKSSAFRPS